MKKSTLLSLAFAGYFLTSVDAKAQWQITNLPTIYDPGCIAVTGTTVIAGTRNNGVYVSTNNGTTWSRSNTGLSDTSVNCIVSGGSTVFVGTQGMYGTPGVYKSTNTAGTWSITAVPDSAVNCLAWDGNFLFSGIKNSGYYTLNQGFSWSRLSATYNPGNLTLGYAYSAANVYVATGGSGVYLSTNFGSTFTPSNSGLTNLNILSIATNSTTIFAGSAQGMYVSTNNAATWSLDTIGMGNQQVSCIYVNSSTDVYAGTLGGGVYYSHNNGATWTAINTGLTSLNVYNLAADATYLYAAQDYSGLWRRLLSNITTGVNEVGVKSNFEMYPNPGSGLIALHESSGKPALLKIFDINGREVYACPMNSGEATLNTQDWNNGIYLVRLFGESSVTQKKLIVSH